jgi:hypothetical protein
MSVNQVNASILEEWQFFRGSIDLSHLGMNSEANRIKSVETD